MNQNAINRRALGGLLGLSLLSLAAPAQAHISMEKATTPTHLSRDGDGNLKGGPCGKAGSTRGTHIYTYEPGQTITINLAEFIPHPSYFRIAFDNDGDDDFVEPASIKPIDPNRKCPTGPGDNCGESDFYNSPTVLPGMDNLDPHLGGLGGLAMAPQYSWDVKLPDIECDNCTLQIIQVMEDDGPHGPYDPTPGVGVEDIYHQCIDIVLKRGAETGLHEEDAGAAAGGDTAGTNGDVGANNTAGVGTGGGTGTDTTTDPVGAGAGGTNGVGTAANGQGTGTAASDPSSSGGCAISARDTAKHVPYGSLFVLGLVAMYRRRSNVRRAQKAEAHA